MRVLKILKKKILLEKKARQRLKKKTKIKKNFSLNCCFKKYTQKNIFLRGPTQKIKPESNGFF